MIFSVSLGQLLVGMRVKGKFIFKRLKFPIRALIGVMTAPLFFIFDLPALISKRTFKEVITFSQYITPKPKTSFIACIIFPVLLLVVLGLAPLFKGFEIREPLTVTENNKPIRKWTYQRPVYVESLNLSYDRTQDVMSLPSFNLLVKGKKKIIQPGIILVDFKTVSGNVESTATFITPVNIRVK